MVQEYNENEYNNLENNVSEHCASRYTYLDKTRRPLKPLCRDLIFSFPLFLFFHINKHNSTPSKTPPKHPTHKKAGVGTYLT